LFKKCRHHLTKIDAKVLPRRGRTGISTVGSQDELLERLPWAAQLLDHQARKVVGEKIALRCWVDGLRAVQACRGLRALAGRRRSVAISRPAVVWFEVERTVRGAREP